MSKLDSLFNESSIKSAEEIFDRLNSEITKEIRIKEKMIANTDYIDWLQNFSSKTHYFNDEFLISYDGNYPKVDDNDAEKIRKLRLFFEIIQEYAKRNYIAVEDELSRFYRIKYNNIGYEIGFCYVDMDIEYFCNRIDILDNVKYINFEDIMRHKDLDDTLEKKRN